MPRKRRETINKSIANWIDFCSPFMFSYDLAVLQSSLIALAWSTGINTFKIRPYFLQEVVHKRVPWHTQPKLVYIVVLLVQWDFLFLCKTLEHHLPKQCNMDREVQKKFMFALLPSCEPPFPAITISIQEAFLTINICCAAQNHQDQLQYHQNIQ